MATHALTQRSGGSASGAGAWATPVSSGWAASAWNGDTGTVSQGGGSGSGTLVEVFGGPLDDAVIPQTAAINSLTFNATYAITAPAGNAGFFVFGGIANAWSGNSGAATSAFVSVGGGLTWADILALGGSLFDWSFQFGTGAHAGGSMRLVVTGFSCLVDYTPVGPAPSLDTIQPTSGAATGGDTVTLRGHGFTAASVPTFDGAAATNIAIASANTLTCTPPPHVIGSVDVSVPGCGTLVNAFRYTARADTANVIIAGSAPNLPPIPAGQSPVDPRTNKIDTMWLRWLNAVKQRVEAVVGADASQIISGLFSVAQIPTLPWSKIDKTGSSLADLTTRNAGDLTIGTLPGARMPALSGAVTTIAGSPITRIPNLPVFWPPDDGGDAVIIPGPAGATGATGATGPPGTGGGGVTIYGCDGQDGDWIPIPGPAGPGGIVVAASLFHSAGQTLTHGTEAALSFDSADYDGSGLHSTVTNTSRITIPAGMAGIYALKGRVTFSTSFEGVVHVRAYKNGGVTPIAEHSGNGSGLSTGNEAHELTVDASLAVSDFVEIKVLVELAAGSGTISTISGSGKTQFQARSAGSIGGGGLPVTTAKGDLLASNGSTFVNVGVGSDATVLTADSTAASGVKWAAAAGGGDLVKIAQITTAGAQATVDFTSIPGTYTSLLLVGMVRDTQTGTNATQLRVKLNADGTAANYSAAGRIGGQNGAAFSSTVASSTAGAGLGSLPQNGNTAGIAGSVRLEIPNYTSASFHKVIYGQFAYEAATTAQTIYSAEARWASLAAVTRVTLGTDGTAFANGLVFTLYGVK